MSLPLLEHMQAKAREAAQIGVILRIISLKRTEKILKRKVKMATSPLTLRRSTRITTTKIDGDQSVQTRAEQWHQSEAKEINSLIQMGAVSPIHNGKMPIELNKRSCRTNQRFHWLRNNYDEADFFTKQLPTPLYEQTRRNLEASESSSY
jgi:hypothetical protein